MNNYFTDEAGNLYDGDQNLIAYAGQYQVDENGNISILDQDYSNQNQDFQENYQQENILDQNQENNQNFLNQEENFQQYQNQDYQEENFQQYQNQDYQEENFQQYQNQDYQEENFSQIQENSENKNNFFDNLSKKFEDFTGNIFGGKKDEKHHEQGIAEKKINLNFEDKYPSEYNLYEDLQNFIKNFLSALNIFKKEKRFSKNTARWKLFFIGKKEVIGFLDRLSVLLNSGIRLVDAVLILKKQSKTQGMKSLLGSLAEKMGNGMHLSEAFEDYNYIFPQKWIQMIKAAEKSGKMSEVLTDLAKEEIAQLEFISKIRGAMIYPGILITMAILVFLGMMKYMVPALEKSFGSVSKLPPLTQKIISMSHFMQDHMFIVLFYPIAFFTIYIFLKSQFITIKKITNWIGLRIPIFGNISKMKNIVMFADNLVLMLSSGVVVSKSLTVVAETMPSILYQKEVHRIRRGINDGYTMSQMMGLSGKMKDENVKENFYFGLEIAQMIKIGEETGNTLGVLRKISEVNNNKLDNIVRNLTSMLEPMITVIIGGMVGTLIVAFMIPMMSSFKNVG